MQLPQIKIQSQQTRIGMESSKPQLEIRQPQADMQIRQPHAKMHINKTPSRLMIDQSQAWASMNIKPVGQMIQEAANEGYQNWLQYLGENAREGSQLMKIENGGNAIPRIAKMQSEDPKTSITIGWIPPAFSVKIKYQLSDLNMRWETHQAQIDVIPHNPRFHFIKGDINIYLKQKNAMQIDVVGVNLDTRK